MDTDMDLFHRIRALVQEKEGEEQDQEQEEVLLLVLLKVQELVLCFTKFKLGTCTFSDRCHFAHGIEDLRKPPPGWEELAKTNLSSGKVVAEAPRRSSKPCRYFFEGNCPYGERCTFSHGGQESQRYDGDQVVERSAVGVAGYGASSRPNYKTRICARWEKGEICSYGEKCHFAHGQTGLLLLYMLSDSACENPLILVDLGVFCSLMKQNNYRFISHVYPDFMSEVMVIDNESVNVSQAWEMMRKIVLLRSLMK